MITKAAISPFFKLEKLRIELHKTTKRNDAKPDVFKAMFNPESFTQSLKNKYFKRKPINGSDNIGYISTASRKLNFKLIVDNTDITDSLSKQSLTNYVEGFIKNVACMDGEIHEPRYIRVKWGDYSLDCRVESLNVKYSLFDRGGNALRADLDIAFIEDVDELIKELDVKKSSPDLTHIKVVKKGDTLSGMSENIYGSPDYYLQVARHNKLNNFRKLKPGTELYFPPIEK